MRLLKDKATFQTLQTWIGHSATRHHNFNVLLHMLPYIFSHFNMVWGYLQCVTMRYRQIYKKYILIVFLENDGSALQTVQNQVNLRQNIYMVTRVVTCSSHGNAFHYGLSMFAEFEKLPYPYVISILAGFHKPSHLLLCNY